MSAMQPPVRRRGLERWAGLGAVAYVVLFIAGVILNFSGQPDSDAPPGEVILYYSKASHRDKITWGWLLVVIGVFFLVWFVGALRQTLRRIDADGTLTTVAAIGGTVYASLTLVGVALNAGIKTMSDDTFHHQVFPELIHAADDAGYVIHASGGVGAAALMIAASLLVSRAGLIPRWVGIVGIVFGVLAIFSIFFFPQFLIAIWLLVAGVLLFWSAGATGEEPAAPVGPAPV
jgi:hypothetical protein